MSPLWALLLAFSAHVVLDGLDVGIADKALKIVGLRKETILFHKKNFETKDFSTVPKDDVRKYWDAVPCNTGWRFDGVEMGSKEHFDLVEERKFTVEPHIPKFAQFSKWNGKQVLEVGGGYCTTAIAFAKAGANVTVVDLSPRSIAMCKERASIHGLQDKLHPMVADAERLTSFLPGRKFDLVWSFGVVHHSPNPALAVEQIAQLVKPDGKVKLMVYAKISWKLFWVMQNINMWNMSLSDEALGHYSEAIEGSPVSYTYTLDGARELVAPFLHVDDVRKAHIFAFDIPEYKKGNLVRDRYWAGVSQEKFEEFEKELGWHVLIDASPRP